MKVLRWKGVLEGWICTFAGFSGSFDILKKQIESVYIRKTRQVIYTYIIFVFTCMKHGFSYVIHFERLFFHCKTPTVISRWDILLHSKRLRVPHPFILFLNETELLDAFWPWVKHRRKHLESFFVNGP